jgi:hypothetical protein
MRVRAVAASLAIIAGAVGAGCGSTSAGRSASSDPPRLVPWSKIGDIALGASKAGVQREYGAVGHGYHVIQRYGDTVQGYYRLHGSRVIVTFYGDRVGELDFTTPYYRTTRGFGVGSKIPLGSCHKTSTNPCEHHWNGFIFGPRLREQPCSCWVKVGRGAQSLPVTGKNFGKPWFFIYTHGGRVTRFYFALRYID